MRWIALVAVLFIAASCGRTDHDLYVKIESNTTWGGYDGQSSFDGFGSQTIDVVDGEIVCVVVSKDTEDGNLTVSLWDQVTTEGRIFAGDETEHNYLSGGSTSAAYGLVTVCTK